VGRGGVEELGDSVARRDADDPRRVATLDCAQAKGRQARGNGVWAAEEEVSGDEVHYEAGQPRLRGGGSRDHRGPGGGRGE
jgi:hypothetical protein